MKYSGRNGKRFGIFSYSTDGENYTGFYGCCCCFFFFLRVDGKVRSRSESGKLQNIAQDEKVLVKKEAERGKDIRYP